MRKRDTSQPAGEPKKRGHSAGRQRVIPPARLRELAAAGHDVTAAAEVLSITPDRLAGLLASRKRHAAAWDRGRLLHAVAAASVGCTLEQTASALEMPVEALRALLEDDPEIRDVRRQARLKALRDMHEALTRQATGDAGRAGSVAAAREILRRLEADYSPAIDFGHLTITQAAPAVGVTRQTIHEWSQRGAPRLADGAISLPHLIAWRVDDLIRQAGRTGPDDDRRLLAMRIEKLRLENAAKRGELLPRPDVIAGLVARAATLRASLEGKPAVWATILQNQTAVRIRQVLEAELSTILLAQTAAPPSLGLPEPLAHRLSDLLADVAMLHHEADPAEAVEEAVP